MDSQSPFDGSTAPIPPPPPQAPQAIDAPPASRPIARWRWWVALIVVGAFPVLAAVSSTTRLSKSGGGAATLPSSVAGLLVAGALQLAIILFFIGISWLFSRATKSELWLHWRGGFNPLWQGALYSIGLRVLAAMPLIGIGIYLSAQGYTPKEVTQWFTGNRPQTDGIVQSIQAGNALYKALMLTFFSFIVAGLGEELWRVVTMRALLEVAPRMGPPLLKSGLAVLVSAIVFGIGHLYQGVLGVGVTAFIGIALGAMTLHYRSIWPAVIAHGCFDATSFLAVVLGADKLAQEAHWWLPHWWLS